MKEGMRGVRRRVGVRVKMSNNSGLEGFGFPEEASLWGGSGSSSVSRGASRCCPDRKVGGSLHPLHHSSRPASPVCA